MRAANPCLIGVTLAIVAAGVARPAEFPEFVAAPGGTGAEGVAALMHGKTIILRCRSLDGEDVEGKVQRLASQLNALAWEGVGPADIVVERAESAVQDAGGGQAEAKPGPPDALMVARDQLLLRLDARHAALSQSTPMDLAEVWAKRLRRIFNTPYVVAQVRKLRVPVGEARAFRFGGRAEGTPRPISYAEDIASVSIDAKGEAVIVRAVGAGTTLAGVRVGEYEATVTVVARKWAAQVPQPLVVRMSGPVEPNLWLARAARVAIRRQMTVEAGAEAFIQEISFDDDEGAAVVSASGPGHFSFARRFPVTLAAEENPSGDPVRAVLSNDPEKVSVPQPLARARLTPGRPVNFLWHHISNGRRRLNLVVRLANAGKTPALIHTIGADGGPSDDEVFVGHAVMQRFVRGRRAGAGCVFELPPRQQCEVSRLELPPGLVVSGLARMTLLAGEAVFVETAATEPGCAAAELAPVPDLMSAQSKTRSLELPGHKELELRQEVGRAWSFLHIGRTAEDADIHPRLRGEYGVMHNISVRFDNPQRREARVEVALRSGGGPARGVIEVDGVVVETGLLAFGEEHILCKHRINGAPTREVSVRLIPQSGSNYPMTLMARSFVK